MNALPSSVRETGSGLTREQTHAQPVFQSCDKLADGGGCQFERSRGSGKSSGVLRDATNATISAYLSMGRLPPESVCLPVRDNDAAMPANLLFQPLMLAPARSRVRVCRFVLGEGKNK